MNVSIINQGCIKEEAKERYITRKFEEHNIIRSKSLEESDYLLYITCAGLGDSIKKELEELDLLNLYSREHNKKVIVVGCLYINHNYLFDEYKKNPNFKFIESKDWIIPVMNYLTDMKKNNTSIEKMRNKTLYLDPSGTNIQFFIQEGCNNHCTFCKVHYNNLILKSFPFEDTLNYLRNMIKNGTKIIHLNGDNLALYGIDLYGRQRLHELIHELSKEEKLEMLYINELLASSMYDDLAKEITSNPKVYGVSFQLETASDRLLKLMNRSYTLEEYDYYMKQMSDAGKYINTVIMSGFPTETNEDMDTTIKYLSDRKIITIGICEYVDFEYLPSSKLTQLSKIEKKRHTKYLLEAKRKINYNIFLEEMPNQNKLIYTGNSNGIYYFNNGVPCIETISKNDKYKDLPLGTVISGPPKRLIKSFDKTNLPKYMI